MTKAQQLAKETAVTDPRIHPLELRVGDVITSDPRRDFPVGFLEVVDFGDVVINPGTRDQARINRDQTVTIRPRA